MVQENNFPGFIGFAVSSKLRGSEYFLLLFSKIWWYKFVVCVVFYFSGSGSPWDSQYGAETVIESAGALWQSRRDIA